MKTLLVAVNAKYIHTCLAAYTLRTYARSKGFAVDMVEYTINQPIDDVVRDLYVRQPDWIGFSCYIWNIDAVKTMAETLRLVMPDVPMWFGGPEVTYDAQRWLEDEAPYADGVIMGEGEATFAALLNNFAQASSAPTALAPTAPNPVSPDPGSQDLAETPGVAYRDPYGKVRVNPPAEPLSMDDVPFPYGEEDDLANRIVYYESSRGCPFSCSYCLSSVEKSVRFRSMDKVRSDLDYFLAKKVRQVKFVDRTFNLNAERTRQIWEYIRDNDNGVTNFHFEMAADLLDEGSLAILRTLRRGLVQFEIGVQTTNEESLRAIHRQTDGERLKQSVAIIKEEGNIHQHLDLIVGLPYEDVGSVQQSFNDVYRMKPEQLQVGFLKVLKGSPIAEESREYQIKYHPRPPYEVMSTKWLTYADIIQQKTVEKMVDAYYNSGQFKMSLSYLETLYPNPYSLFQALGEYHVKRHGDLVNHARIWRYETLLAFYKEKINDRADEFVQLLTHDLYHRENLKKRPDFAREEDEGTKEAKRAFYEKDENIAIYLPNHRSYEKRQITRMTHFERFFVDIHTMAETGEIIKQDVLAIFDYLERDPITNDARVQYLRNKQTCQRKRQKA